MNHSPDLRPLAGFTRLDVLFSVTTVSLLLAVALPAASTPVTQSRSLICMENLRQITAAWATYADDYGGRFVPNLSGEAALNPQPGRAGWAAGWLDWYTSSKNTNTAVLTHERYSALAPYIGGNATWFWCPADGYLSPVQMTRGWSHRVRSYSMNYFVGRSTPEILPEFQEFDEYADFRQLSPSRAFLLTEEHPDSINDPAFVFSPIDSQWTDLPASHHDGGCWFSFVDGHVELRLWQSATTIQPVTFRFPLLGRLPPTDPDYLWLQERVTELR